MEKISIYISTLFKIGYFPKAPGTAGTFFALLIYFILPATVFEEYKILFMSFLIVFSLISVIFIRKAEEKFGNDDGKIVLDEFLGYFFAILFFEKSLFIGFIAFFLFRFFDIFKPEPVNALQKLPRGWGVIADDIMAGVYSNIALRLILLIIKLL